MHFQGTYIIKYLIETFNNIINLLYFYQNFILIHRYYLNADFNDVYFNFELRDDIKIGEPFTVVSFYTLNYVGTYIIYLDVVIIIKFNNIIIYIGT